MKSWKYDEDWQHKEDEIEPLLGVDDEAVRRKRESGSSQNYVTHVKEADLSPLISSTADASFVIFMALCLTNGGFLALALLGIRYWNKTENVTKKEGSDGPDTNQKTPTTEELMNQLRAQKGGTPGVSPSAPRTINHLQSFIDKKLKN
jgi:hypothetical protein